MESNIILVIILGISIVGKATSVAISVAALLILKLLGLDKYIFPYLNDKGMFWGLVLLTAAILIPIAQGNVKAIDIKNNLVSFVGITALVLSFLTTYLSGVGLRYLTVQGHSDVMPSLILGSVAAAAFLGGVPVGPLITSGILALIVKMVKKS
ncbi:membrane protein [Clostridium acetobutylicum]|nr:membrane protein [Clostridium acetobutylicum]